MERRKKQALPQFYIILVLSCLVLTVLAVFQCFQFFEEERLLEEKRQAIIKVEKENQQEADEINQQISSLDILSLTLEDKEKIDDLQKRINTANEDVKKKIVSDRSLLLLAQSQIETKYAKQNQYHNIYGNRLDEPMAMKMEEICNQAEQNFSVYFKSLEDGSTYLYRPLINYDMSYFSNISFGLYLFDNFETRLNSIEKEWLDAMLMNHDDVSTKRLVNRYFRNKDGFYNYLNGIGFTEVKNLYNNGNGLIKGQMNVIDVGHVMVAYYHLLNENQSLKKKLCDDNQVRFANDGSNLNYDLEIIYGDAPYILCFLSDKKTKEIESIKQELNALISEASKE